jgi:hypothetical protein
MATLNLSAILLDRLPPMELRFLGSLGAAPVFVMLSGFLVAFTAGRHDLRYYLVHRALWLFAVGALVDLAVWRIYPFMSAEVLYLIGISIPVAYLSLKLTLWPRLALIAGTIVLAPFLRSALGYTDFPREFYLWGDLVWPQVPSRPVSPLEHWLVDGWFPVFPWVAFALLGAHLGLRMHLVGRGRFLREAFLAGVALTTAGGLWYGIRTPDALPRGVWSELFYPPTTRFTLLALGVSTLSVALAVRLGSWRPALTTLEPFRVMGRVALGLYVAHLALAVYFGLWYAGGWSRLSLGEYAIAYGVLLGVLLLLALVFEQLREGHGPVMAAGLRAGVVLALLGGAAVLIAAELSEGSAFADGLNALMRRPNYY